MEDKLFKKGIKNGLSTFWYENGKKWKEGNYSKGDSIGEWVFWDETGIMIDKKQYRNLKNRYILIAELIFIKKVDENNNFSFINCEFNLNLIWIK